jgi:hypothetical protein
MMKTVLTLWLVLALTVGTTFSQGYFIAIGGVDTKDSDGDERPGEFGTIYLSKDGEHWENVHRGGPVTDRFDHAHNNFLRCLTYGNGVFVATGSPGLFFSKDGHSWEYCPGSSGTMSVEFGGGRFVAPSASEAQISTDGVHWKKITPPLATPVWGKDGAGHIRKTVYGNGHFLCMGEQRISVTRDGETWTHHEVLPEEKRPGQFDLAFGAGRFVWVSQKQPPQSSTDGVHWSPIEFPYGPALRDYTGLWSGDAFLVHAHGGKGASFRSTDGVLWTREEFAKGSVETIGGGVLLRTQWPKGFGRSTDDGKTWQIVAPELRAWRIYYFDGRELVGRHGG